MTWPKSLGAAPHAMLGAWCSKSWWFIPELYGCLFMLCFPRKGPHKWIRKIAKGGIPEYLNTSKKSGYLDFWRPQVASRSNIDPDLDHETAWNCMKLHETDGSPPSGTRPSHWTSGMAGVSSSKVHLSRKRRHGIQGRRGERENRRPRSFRINVPVALVVY